MQTPSLHHITSVPGVGLEGLVHPLEIPLLRPPDLTEQTRG